MKHRQTGFLVRESSGAFNQFDQLVRGFELEPSGQRGLQILLQKLALPAIAALEGQVHSVTLLSRGHGASIDEEKENIVHIIACAGE
jgi:hypothetical protein